MKKLFLCMGVILAVAAAAVAAPQGYTIVVLPFASTVEAKDAADLVYENFRQEITDKYRFTVISKVKTESILNNLGLGNGACATAECASQIGRQLEADKVLLGEVRKQGNDYIVTLRIVDASTATINWRGTERITMIPDLKTIPAKLSINAIHQLEMMMIMGDQGATYTDGSTEPETDTDDQNLTVAEPTNVIIEDVINTNEVESVADATTNTVNIIADTDTDDDTGSPIKPPISQPTHPYNRKISFWRLFGAECAAVCAPGLGLGHLVIGDYRGFGLCLGATLLSGGLYIANEYAVESGTIDDVTAYNVIRYSLCGLYAASIVFDIVHTPVYWYRYNQRIAQSSTSNVQIAVAPYITADSIGAGAVVCYRF